MKDWTGMTTNYRKRHPVRFAPMPEWGSWTWVRSLVFWLGFILLWVVVGLIPMALIVTALQ